MVSIDEMDVFTFSDFYTLGMVLFDGLTEDLLHILILSPNLYNNYAYL